MKSMVSILSLTGARIKYFRGGYKKIVTIDNYGEWFPPKQVQWEHTRRYLSTKKKKFLKSLTKDSSREAESSALRKGGQTTSHHKGAQ